LGINILKKAIPAVPSTDIILKAKKIGNMPLESILSLIQLKIH
jgi:hypothetical protein